jgi:hypothetical protein
VNRVDPFSARRYDLGGVTAKECGCLVDRPKLFCSADEMVQMRSVEYQLIEEFDFDVME